MKEKILEILQEIRPDINFLEEEQLLTKEILDSFDIISIITLISEKLKIDIDLTMINEKNFDSLEKMVSYLKKSSRSRTKEKMERE